MGENNLSNIKSTKDLSLDYTWKYFNMNKITSTIENHVKDTIKILKKTSESLMRIWRSAYNFNKHKNTNQNKNKKSLYISYTGKNLKDEKYYLLGKSGNI